MKLANLRRLDPTSASGGLDAGSHLDGEVWHRFEQDIAGLRKEARAILSPPRFWLKLVYNRERQTDAAVWRSRRWVSDSHRFSRGGKPSHRPGYSVADEIVVYDLEFRRCPARLQVKASPIYDPKRVEREGSAGDGARWGWLTEVQAVASVDVRRAPRLEDLGVDARGCPDRR